MACSHKCKCYTTVGFGITFFSLGLLLLIGWPYLYSYILQSQLSLRPDSISYNMWKETPIPMYMDVYLFNWTNALEVEKDWRIKPIVEEIGPYVFSEHHVRKNVNWNDNNTITFQQVRTWHFQPSLSNGTLDDEITNFNVIAATVAYFVRHKHFLIQRAVDWIMREKKEKLFLTRSARELLFDGYEDELLDLFKELNVSSINIPFKKFGWFVERNGSAPYDGTFNMFTGADDLKNLGMMDKWNGNSSVPFYPGKCGEVVGTTGELWPPVVGNKSVNMFISDMCSSGVIDYSEEAELYGIEGERYTATERLFDIGEKFKEQKCFDLGENTPNGIRNVSECRFGAPAFLSLPHFYLADKSLQDRVQGLNPNPNLHQLYLEIEPSTGLPLKVHARAQVNILIQPIKGIKMYDHVVRTFMPMMWFEQRATLTSEYASLIKVLLILPNIGFFTGLGCGIFGVLLFFVLIGITCRKEWRGTEGDKLITAESTTTLTAT